MVDIGHMLLKAAHQSTSSARVACAPSWFTSREAVHYRHSGCVNYTACKQVQFTEKTLRGECPPCAPLTLYARRAASPHADRTQPNAYSVQRAYRPISAFTSYQAAMR